MTPERLDIALKLMYLMTTAIAVITISAAVVVAIAVWRTERGALRTLSMMAQRFGILQLLTVQVIVTSAFLLCLLGLLGAEATVSILSGIAGYVLGNLSRTRSEPERDPERQHSN